MGTQCTIGTHATFIPPEDHRDVERAVLDSQAAVLKWMMDLPRDETDREDGSGLEFECQQNTPSLAKLHQLKESSRTNMMALRRTLLDKQDLLRMDMATSWKKGIIQQKEGGGSEPEPENVLGCASNAEEHGRPDKSIQKDGALHVERTNPKMRAGMTSPQPGILACKCVRLYRKNLPQWQLAGI